MKVILFSLLIDFALSYNPSAAVEYAKNIVRIIILNIQTIVIWEGIVLILLVNV